MWAEAQAAAQAILTLRQKKFDGRITLVGEEDLPPYQRPPLSKKYLAGELDRERLFLRPLAFYEKNGVELRLGVRAEEIEPDRRRIRLDDGGRWTMTVSCWQPAAGFAA